MLQIIIGSSEGKDINYQCSYWFIIIAIGLTRCQSGKLSTKVNRKHNQQEKHFASWFNWLHLSTKRLRRLWRRFCCFYCFWNFSCVKAYALKEIKKNPKFFIRHKEISLSPTNAHPYFLLLLFVPRLISTGKDNDNCKIRDNRYWVIEKFGI